MADVRLESSHIRCLSSPRSSSGESHVIPSPRVTRRPDLSSDSPSSRGCARLANACEKTPPRGFREASMPFSTAALIFATRDSSPSVSLSRRTYLKLTHYARCSHIKCRMTLDVPRRSVPYVDNNPSNLRAN